VTTPSLCRSVAAHRHKKPRAWLVFSLLFSGCESLNWILTAPFQYYPMRSLLSVKLIQGCNMPAKSLIVTLLLIAITGCSVPLTKEASRLKLVRSSSPILNDCTLLGSVIGKSKSAAFSGEIGRSQAINNAINKAAANFPGSDTVSITSSKWQVVGGRADAFVYNCSEPKVNLIRKAEERVEPTAITNELIRKAQKCQKSGGIWVNNTCVINID